MIHTECKFSSIVCGGPFHMEVKSCCFGRLRMRLISDAPEDAGNDKHS